MWSAATIFGGICRQGRYEIAVADFHMVAMLYFSSHSKVLALLSDEIHDLPYCIEFILLEVCPEQ